VSDNASPSVLIVLPTLGERLEFLKLTLDSIGSQEGVEVVLVVVVPKRATEARAFAEQYGAVILDDPGSHSGAINLAFSVYGADCQYGNWIGDDDLLLPDALKTAVSALERNSRSPVAYGYCNYIDDDGEILFTSRMGRLAPWLMTWGPDLVPQPGALFRMSAVQRAGGLDESLRYAMDLDLLLRLRRFGAFSNTRTTLAAFRWHADSKTVANRNGSLSEGEIVKRRYLSPPMARAAWIWEGPVRVATRMAARRVEHLAAMKQSKR
jgi:GT2 family glycosyltransferase